MGIENPTFKTQSICYNWKIVRLKIFHEGDMFGY